MVICFFPVPKHLRKIIKKEAGDFVYIEIFEDLIPTSIPSELKDCFKDYPGTLVQFKSLSDAEQNRWIQYIFSSVSDETKADRIIQLLNFLA